MFDSDVFRLRAAELVDVGRFFFSRGWLPATSGNLSARLDERRIAITVSGRHKGDLDESGIMALDLDGNILSEGCRPSAETGLHLMLYRRDPSVGAVLHTHSVNATVMSRLAGDTLLLSGYEVLKAWPGVETHEATVRIPVFANDQDISRLAEQVERELTRTPSLPAYLIVGHGLYTWGNNVADARRNLEAFEFLLECETLMRRLTP
jgi:methylthioribulose-1-phosphate dehydratase